MQIDSNLISMVVLGVLGAFWKHIAYWMKRVDGRFEEIAKQEVACNDKFLTREAYAEGKSHVWRKLEDLEKRLRELEMNA